MRLSELNEVDAKVIRDAEINSCGLLDYNDMDNMLIYVESIKFLKRALLNSSVSAVITNEEIANSELLRASDLGVLCCETPKKSFYQLHNMLYKTGFFYNDETFASEISKSAYISKTATIASEGVKIGDGCIISDGAVINRGTVIGNNCFIGDNTVVGTRGFQYYSDDAESFYVEHAAGVEIGNNVEIFSNVCIAKGLFKKTKIGDNVKIDNLVHISHSDEIGDFSKLAAATAIAGSVKIGKRVWLGMGATVTQNVKIEDDAYVCAGSTVVNNIKSKEVVSGNFAVEHAKHLYDTKRIMKLE